MILAAAVSMSAQDASQNPQKVDKKIHYNNFFEMLRGQPGVQVNGEKVFIRGISTNSNNTDPLFVVDGMITPASSMSSLDPKNVESIEIIKDGTAAIYGMQGGNGVIMVTTVAAANKARQEAEAAKAAKAEAKAAKKAEKANKKK